MGRAASLSHHPDAFAIGTDPGGAVADSPLVFLKTSVADLKTAGTTPTEDLSFFAAVALIFADLSFAVSACFGQ